MAIIVLHNSDSQGSRADWAFEGRAHAILKVTFTGNRISAESMQAIGNLAIQHPGPNTVIWMGHGNEGKKVPGTAGHPLNEGLLRIDSRQLIQAFRMLSPEKIYLFTCMAMQWVERERQAFYDAMLYQSGVVKIFAASKKLIGGALMPVAVAIAAGQENPAGAFGQGKVFEETQVYGEEIMHWQHRRNPQRTAQGAWESPL
ncbi:MAG TPA: hypothetical protein VF006_02370 [Longimicrobium sp.]